MEPPNDTSLFRDIGVERNLLPYLQLTGWEFIDETNNHWYVFKGGKDSDGNPLEIILPKNPNARDLGIYVENAVNLLSSLANETIQNTIKRIVFYDCDVLFSRNLETEEHNSITLKVAAQQVKELKQLVNYAACSEHEPKPYFLQGQLSIANAMVEHYRFGHTFAGSFGFTILSRLIRLPQPYFQLRLFPEEKPPLTTAPVERRVMERIVRGLSTAESQHETMILIF